MLLYCSIVLAVAFRPDGKQLATSSLDGMIRIWEGESGKLIGTIEGRRDIAGGRGINDRQTAQNSSKNKYFLSLCYSADGRCILAGGNSKYVCIYHAGQQILLKRFEITRNLSLDAMQDLLNSRDITESGVPRQLINDVDSDDDKNDRSLPGVQSGKLTERSKRLRVRYGSYAEVVLLIGLKHEVRAIFTDRTFLGRGYY